MPIEVQKGKREIKYVIGAYKPYTSYFIHFANKECVFGEINVG